MTNEFIYCAIGLALGFALGRLTGRGVLTMRLIDADAILKADENSDKALVLGSGKALEIAYALLKKKVADAPTVDAVPVVRCKDCKHLVAVNVNGKGIPTCRVSGMEVAPDEFCSRGEKGRRC